MVRRITAHLLPKPHVGDLTAYLRGGAVGYGLIIHCFLSLALHNIKSTKRLKVSIEMVRLGAGDDRCLISSYIVVHDSNGLNAYFQRFDQR